MHSARLQAEQAMHFYAGNGSTIYLSSGVCWVSPAPIWLESPYFIREVPLHEGEVFMVQRSGWMSVRAARASQIVCIAAPTLLDRLRRFFSGFAQRRQSGRIGAGSLPDWRNRSEL